MVRYFLTTTAVVALLGAGPVAAQQANQAQGSQNQPTQAQGSQAGQSNQRLTQEVARYKGSELYISPAGVRQIEQALNQAGYQAGGVDGIWDKASARAALNFQQAQGLEPTGTLTVSTIRSLGLGALLSGQKVAQQQVGQSNQRLTQETAPSPGAPLYASPAAVRVVQQALNEAGYQSGDVNGIWTKATSTAARNFQQAQGLEPTGVLDVSLIQALGVGPRMFAGAGGPGSSNQRLAQESATSTNGQAGAQNAQGKNQKSAQGATQQQAVVGAAGGGTPIYIGAAGVRQLTQMLNEAGYNAGHVDGDWDNNTKEAMANFQQANGLEPTGTLTTVSLAALGLQQWLPSQVMQGGQGGGNFAAAGNAGVGGAGGGAPGDQAGMNGGAQAGLNGAANGGGGLGAQANAGGGGAGAGINASVGGVGVGAGAAAASGAGGNATVASAGTAGGGVCSIAFNNGYGYNGGFGGGNNNGGAFGNNGGMGANNVGGNGGLASNNIGDNAGSATTTGNAAGGAMGMQTVAASQLQGMDVIGATGDKVGDVKGIVQSNGQEYIILKSGGFLGIGGHSVALPVNSITMCGNSLVLPQYTEQQIDQMRQVDPDQYPEMAANDQVQIRGYGQQFGQNNLNQ